MLLLVLISLLSAQAVWRDPSPHRVRMVAVDRDVRLEVLEWDGSGPNLVLLGCYLSAHMYDDFAPTLAVSTSTALHAEESGLPTSRLRVMRCNSR